MKEIIEELDYEKIYRNIRKKKKKMFGEDTNRATKEALILTAYKIFEKDKYLGHNHGWLKIQEIQEIAESCQRENQEKREKEGTVIESEKGQKTTKIDISKFQKSS